MSRLKVISICALVIIPILAGLIFTLTIMNTKNFEETPDDEIPIQFGTEAEAIAILGGDEYFTREGNETIQLSFSEPKDYNAARWVCHYYVYDPVKETREEGLCEFVNPNLTNEDIDILDLMEEFREELK